MASDSLLSITAWSKGFQRLQQIDALVSAQLDPRRNAVGTGTFTIPSDHPTAQWLNQDGARVVCQYRGLIEMSGTVELAAPELQQNGRTTYTVEDDVRIVQNTLGWVRPIAAGSSQGQAQAQALNDDAQAVSTVAHTAGTDAGYGAYIFDAQLTGSSGLTAEAAVKELVRRNLVQRLGRPVTIAADQGRGGDALAAGKLPALRMAPLLDQLQDLLNWAKLTLSVQQSLVPGQGFLLDVYQGTLYDKLITLESGLITEGVGQRQKPKATRAVIGGPGSDTARAWATIVDAATEARYGDIVEVLKDASGVGIKWDNSITAGFQVPKYYHLQNANGAANIAAFLKALQDAGQEALTDGAAKSGLNMTLAETDSVHYGGPDGFRRGDTLSVPITPATVDTPALTLSGTVSGGTITLAESGELTAQTLVGDRTDDPDKQLSDAIAGLQTALRRAAARK